MKSYGVAIQQYFHRVLFIYYIVLTFESVDEIPGVTIQLNLFSSIVVTFESVDEIRWCYHSTKPLQQYFHMVLFN